MKRFYVEYTQDNVLCSTIVWEKSKRRTKKKYEGYEVLFEVPHQLGIHNDQQVIDYYRTIDFQSLEYLPYKMIGALGILMLLIPQFVR